MKISSNHTFTITFFLLWVASNYSRLLFGGIPHPENVFFLAALGYIPFRFLYEYIEKRIESNRKGVFSIFYALFAYAASSAILILIMWVITWLA